jgi:hypothetical protein
MTYGSGASPEYLRKEAENCRLLAQQISDGQGRLALARIAAEFELLARQRSLLSA